MNALFLLSLAAALAAAPLAYAHDPAGAPKLHCETPEERRVHDYGAPATGLFLHGFTDGNVEDCDGDGVPADADGHREWTGGGAWLLAGQGDGATHGAAYCFGEDAHHPAYPTVRVRDLALPSGVAFFVVADALPAGWHPAELGCGWGGAEHVQECVDECAVTFPPSPDGSYRVYVQAGTQGHVETP